MGDAPQISPSDEGFRRKQKKTNEQTLGCQEASHTTHDPDFRQWGFGLYCLQAWTKVGGILTKTTSCVIQRIQPLVNDIPRWPVLVAAKGYSIDNHQS